MSWSAASVAALCLVAAPLVAQAGQVAVHVATPLDARQLAAYGVSITPLQGAEGSGRGSVLRWRTNELPLSVPPDRVAVGAFDADFLVVLAGGIRHSLDIYFLRASGRIARLATDGGRRLPPAFRAASGTGSWPVAVGGSVFIAAYDKDGRIEVCALGFDDQRFASRALTSSTTGYRVEATAERIAISPIGVDTERPIEFAHPDAPRLEFQEVSLHLEAPTPGGSVASRATLLNRSQQSVVVDLEVDAAAGAFAVEPRRVELPANSERQIEISFVGDHDRRGRLLARRVGGQRVAVLPLFGRTVGRTALDAVAPPADWTAPTRKVWPPTAPAVGTESSPAPPPADAGPTRAHDAGHAAPPRLVRERDGVELRGLPRETLTLAVVALMEVNGEPQPAATLASFRASLDGDGRLTLPLRAVFGEYGAGALIALRPGQRDAQSNLLVVD